MRNVIQTIFDVVFSFPVFVLLVVIGFGFILFKLLENDANHREQTRIATEACYAQGMVLIDTPAGQRCVDPRFLVKVK